MQQENHTRRHIPTRGQTQGTRSYMIQNKPFRCFVVLLCFVFVLLYSIFTVETIKYLRLLQLYVGSSCDETFWGGPLSSGHRTYHHHHHYHQCKDKQALFSAMPSAALFFSGRHTDTTTVAGKPCPCLAPEVCNRARG